jgi:hypothetical protein
MNISKKLILLSVGIALGAIGGYLYFHYIGCISGTCMITSRPLPSTLYGAMMGGLLVSSVNDFINSKSKDSKQIK